MSATSSWDKLRGVTLSAPTLSFLRDVMHFTATAPVQARTIPLLLSNYDVVVEAITGSGKTLAYLVPCLEMLLRPRSLEVMRSHANAVIAVIILPSRELAQQVYELTRRMLHYVSKEYKPAAQSNTSNSSKKIRGQPGSATELPEFSCQCYIGGRDVQLDVQDFNAHGGNVLIGTPGRLFELLVTSKHAALFNFIGFELLILDEADKLLEYGFMAKLDAIIKRLPKQRRTGLFSATQTHELAELARAGMRNPVSVTVRLHPTNTNSTDKSSETAKPQVPERLTNYYAFTKAAEKLDRLVDFLRARQNQKVLVYVMTCASVDWLYEALAHVLLKDVHATQPVFALHGQMKLAKRQAVHKQVTRRQQCVLVCTDVAARGLDIPDVAVVVQYDPPVDPNTFIHRIGRTARMGRQGESVVFLMPQELEYVAFMSLQNVPLQPLDTQRDDLEQAKAAVAQLNARRTLRSSSVPDQRKAIHQAHRMKQLTRKERRARLHAARHATSNNNNNEENDGTSESTRNGRRGEVRGDLCESPSVLALRRAAMTNDKLLQLATRAFVSFIRAYKEHECRYIFQLQHIDLTDLTHGFGLFKVPSCGEIRRMQILKIPLQDEFTPFLRILAERLQRKRQREADETTHKNGDSAGGDGGDEGPVPRTERNARLEELKHMKLSQSERSRAWKQAEIDELMKDSYYVKKERRGKISERVVDEKMGVDAIENALLSVRERHEAKKIRRKH